MLFLELVLRVVLCGLGAGGELHVSGARGVKGILLLLLGFFRNWIFPSRLLGLILLELTLFFTPCLFLLIMDCFFSDFLGQILKFELVLDDERVLICNDIMLVIFLFVLLVEVEAAYDVEPDVKVNEVCCALDLC